MTGEKIRYERYFDVLRSPAYKRLRSASRGREVRFVLHSAMWALGLWIAFVTFTPAPRAVVAATVAVVARVTASLGLPSQMPSPDTLSFGGSFDLVITSGCTAYAVAILFAAAVLASEAPLSRRLVGLFAGIPLVFALNVVRLVSLAWMSVYAPGAFADAHTLLWQAAIIVVIGLVWTAWADWARSSHDAPSVPRPGSVAMTVVGFLAAFLVLGVAGLALGADRLYVRPIVPMGLVLARAIGGPSHVIAPTDAVKQASYFAQILSVACAALAHRAVPLRRRLRILGWILPATVALHVAQMATSATTVRFARSYVHYALTMLVGVVGILAWILCARVIPETSPARAEGCSARATGRAQARPR